MDASRVGVNVHLASRDLLERMQAAGFTWIRVDANWDMIEPEKGVYHWDIIDEVVRHGCDLGLSIYPTLSYTPSWANGQQGRHVPPFDPQDWFHFVYAFVSRYRDRVRYYGLWNEPNLPHFWGGTDLQYVSHILLFGASAVRQADPHSHVCAPELSMEGDWARWLQAILRNGGNLIDVLTVHNYQDTGREVIRRVCGPQTWLMWLKRQIPVRDILIHTGIGDRPLWVTETGQSTGDVSEADQASYYDQVIESMTAGTPIEKIFFYQHCDEAARDGQDPVRWGILREDLTPKPAYHVCQQRLQRIV